MPINNLSITYPDFVLNQVIDPEQFDINNAEFVSKINEIISTTNSSVVNITDVITKVSNTLAKDNLTAYVPVTEYNPATKSYVDSVIAGVVLGIVSDGSITDVKLSNVAGQIKDRVNNINIKGVSTLPNTGWVANTGDYSLKYNLAIAGVTTTSFVTISPTSQDYVDVCSDAEISPVTTEYNGGVTIYAKTNPTASVALRYVIA